MGRVQTTPSRTARACVRWYVWPLLGLTAVSALLLPRPAFGEEPRLAIDADPSGNGATQPRPVEPCISVDTGEVLTVDVVVFGVVDLLAWEVTLEYDPNIIGVTSRHVGLFQEGSPGSSVYDVSDPLPDRSGRYRLAAADTADPPAPASGSGTLARLTFTALAPGMSTIAIVGQDATGDGTRDARPVLRNAAGDPIGDKQGDTFFDGPMEDALVVVGSSCPWASWSIPADAPSEEGGRDNLLYVIAGSAIALSAIVIASVIVLARRRSDAQPGQSPGS